MIKMMMLDDKNIILTSNGTFFLLRPLSETQHVSSRGYSSLSTALLEFFKDTVSLTQEEIEKNSKTVNDFIVDLLPLIHQQDEIFGLGKLNTGEPLLLIRVQSNLY